MKVTEKPKTVCLECEYCKPSGEFNMYYGCINVDPVYSTVTGNKLENWTLCRDKNDGNCPDYKTKAPLSQ